MIINLWNFIRKYLTFFQNIVNKIAHKVYKIGNIENQIQAEYIIHAPSMHADKSAHYSIGLFWLKIYLYLID